ncbi:hypothetical protein KEM56_006424 [Ascosphaera pollenicola]|nr:hypothetical protein KEM56_006424 [Ascosphaera pollenicola]
MISLDYLSASSYFYWRKLCMLTTQSKDFIMSHVSSLEKQLKTEIALAQEGWRGIQKPFVWTLTAAFISLQMLFFGNMLYMHASQFRSTHRYHNLNVLYVDFDGALIGQSVLDAYGKLQGDSFPTIQQKSPEIYLTPQDVRQAVCDGGYWAAVYANTNASQNLVTSITKGGEQSVGVSYVWNSALWPPFTESGIHAKIETLLDATRQAYYDKNASTMIRHTNLSSHDALNSYLNPVKTEEINILPTEQGARILYNTVSMVMPIIQQFFFMVAMNGIAEQFQIFTRIGWKVNFGLRMLVSYAFTLSTALCMAGYFWAYKESWNVNGGQYFLSVLVLWMYAHIHILMVDIGTAFLPLPLMPFCVLTWIIVNVTSTVAPFEISPGFFRWGYVLPGRVTYEILLQIWSRGCNNHLYRTLPALLGWEIVGSLVAPWGIFHRCNAAIMAKQLRESEDRSILDVHHGTHIGVEDPGMANLLTSEARKQQSRRMSQRLQRLAYGPSFPTYALHEHAHLDHLNFSRGAGTLISRTNSRSTREGPRSGMELRVPRFSFEDSRSEGTG